MYSKKFCRFSLGPIYYCGLFFGVFPYQYDENLLYPSANVDENAFSISKAGLCICYAFAVVQGYGFGYVFYESYVAAHKFESCFENICSLGVCRNVCAHFVILWINYSANVISTFTILVLRLKSTLKCINETNNMMKMNVYEYRFMVSYWVIIVFLIVQGTSYTLHWWNSDFLAAFLYTYAPLHLAQCLPLVTENFVSVLLLVIENSYASVNRKIVELCGRRFVSGRRNDELEYLRIFHWTVTDLTDTISDVFGLDFFTVGVCSSIRFIYFLFLTLQYTAQQQVINSDGGLVLPSYQSVVFSVSVVGKFVYLCYRCDRVVSEAEKVVANLYILLNKYRCECNEDGEVVVSEFLDQVKCRQVSFKAYDFFTINLHLICKVFGLAMTYFIVLMQFQVSHVT